MHELIELACAGSNQDRRNLLFKVEGKRNEREDADTDGKKRRGPRREEPGPANEKVRPTIPQQR